MLPREREGKHVIAEVVSQYGEARRRPTMASARGLQRGAGAAIMLFPPFLCPLPSALCILHSALTPLRRRLAALTPPLVQKTRVGELTGGKWMDGWWIHSRGWRALAQSTRSFFVGWWRWCQQRKRPPSEPSRPSRRAKQGSRANRDFGTAQALFSRSIPTPHPAQPRPLEMTMGPRAVDVGWTRWRPEVAVEPGLHKSWMGAALNWGERGVPRR
ncbi:hypothetical protein V8C34DRAFT_277430 [Trichoderma compactum]